MKQIVYFNIFILIANIYSLKVFAQDHEQKLTLRQYFTGTVDQKDYALLISSKTAPNNPEFHNEKIGFTELSNSLSNRFDFVTELSLQLNIESVYKKLDKYANLEYSKQDQLLIYFDGFDWNFGINDTVHIANESQENTSHSESGMAIKTLLNRIDSIPVKHLLIIIDINNKKLMDEIMSVFRDVRVGESCDFKNYQKLNTRKLIIVGSCQNINNNIHAGVEKPFIQEFTKLIKTTDQIDKVLCLAELDKWLIENSQFCAHFAGFGSDEPGSEFLFIQN